MNGFDTSVFLTYFPALLWSARVTLSVSILAFLFSAPLGLLITLMRVSDFRFLRFASFLYVDAIRGTPLLVQILIALYVLPQFGLDLSPFHSGVIALGVNSSAYQAEILRGGMQALPRGQIESARSLGFNYLQCLRRIIMPQVIYRVLPPLTNEVSSLIKGSSLVSIIAVVELTRTGQQIVSVIFHPLEIYTAVALIYLSITLLFAALSDAMERHGARYI